MTQRADPSPGQWPRVAVPQLRRGAVPFFCEEGFHVVRYDNRDVGLSTKLDGTDYALTDMANDAVAVLDAMGVDRAHVMGCSMGGMIVQRLALDHTDRLLSLTSVMSRTGEPGYGDSSEEALAFFWRRRRRPGRPISSARWPPSMCTGRSPSGSTTMPSGPGPLPPTTAASVPRARPADEGGHAGWLPFRGAGRAGSPHPCHPRQPGHAHQPERRAPHRRGHSRARYVEIDGMGHDYPPPVWGVGGRLVRVRPRRRCRT